MATKSASATPAAVLPRRPRPDAPVGQGQLRLVIDDARTPWKLDETTRKIGREGVAQARAILRSATAPPVGEAA